MARRWRTASRGWKWISASSGLAKQKAMPRGGVSNIWQAAHAYCSFLHPTCTYTTHTYQFPSSAWAGALDRYKGLSGGVQSRLDPCPQRTNELQPTHLPHLCTAHLHMSQCVDQSEQLWQRSGCLIKPWQAPCQLHQYSLEQMLLIFLHQFLMITSHFVFSATK